MLVAKSEDMLKGLGMTEELDFVPISYLSELPCQSLGFGSRPSLKALLVQNTCLNIVHVLQEIKPKHEVALSNIKLL